MKNIAKYIRRIIYIVLGTVDKLIGIKTPNIIILCYHGIGNGRWIHEVRLSSFYDQINYLLSTREPITLNELELYIYKGKSISKPSFIITFDDGYQSILSTTSFFKKNNITPSLFIFPDSKKINRKELGTNSKLLSIAEVNSLIQNGWDIGSHSLTHSNFANLSLSNQTYEITESKQELKNILGITVKYFTYPKGRYSKSIVSKLITSGYKLGLTMDDGIIDKETNPFLIPRIGINKTHSLLEFKYCFSPSVIFLRNILKKFNLNRFYE